MVGTRKQRNKSGKKWKAEKIKRKQLCTSGKIGYETMEGTLFFTRVYKARYATKLKTYKCNECGKYHLASKKTTSLSGLQGVMASNRAS